METTIFFVISLFQILFLTQTFLSPFVLFLSFYYCPRGSRE
jgi:hypothetical protein